jgi:Mg/Co/Ni transporter MgtE
MSTAKNQKLGLFQILLSVLASFLGVQNEANRERDFSQGKASHFIAVAIVLTAILVGVILGIVWLVIHFAV